MKVILVTFVTPASENIRGTSALPYHLIKGMRMGALGGFIPVEVYTFNNNGLSDEKIAKVEKELEVTINKIPLPRWYRWIFKLHLLSLRVFLKFPMVNYISLPRSLVSEINAQKPDLIWVYQEELSRVVKQFPGHRRIQIGPDTESLYYYRMMGQRLVMKNAAEYWKCALMYRKYARMERCCCADDNFTFYAVGEEDVQHLRQLNPEVRAKFLRHPHYEVSSQSTFKFHEPKIRVLIAGRYDLYMRQAADDLFEEFRAQQYQELKSLYTYTFLGKGWEKHVGVLRETGYDVTHIQVVPNYIEEICKYDIQITPIAIGTGTKGKVLDALANGLLVIGTTYAMENIAVKHGDSCIEYQQPQEVIDVLREISRDKERYEAIARAGQESVLKYHDRGVISKELFES